MSEIETLRAQLAEAKHTLNCCKEADALQSDEIDKLKAENEALRKDAERYRFLRRTESAIDALLDFNEGFVLMEGEKLDAAIDAVRG